MFIGNVCAKKDTFSVVSSHVSLSAQALDQTSSLLETDIVTTETAVSQKREQ